MLFCQLNVNAVRSLSRDGLHYVAAFLLQICQSLSH
jgi:hypothetical protein